MPAEVGTADAWVQGCGCEGQPSLAGGLMPGLLGNVGVGLDLDMPGGVEESCDDHHGGGWAGDGEELAVDAGDLFPVPRVREVDAGANDVLDGGAGLFEGCGDDGETLLGLGCGVGVVRADGPGSGDVDVRADANGAGKADHGLVGAAARDVFADHACFGCLPDARSAETAGNEDAPRLV